MTLAVLLSAPAAHAAWTGTTADQQISFDDNEYASYVRLAVDGSDTIHVVWSEDDPSYDEIHYGFSTDGGATWSCSSSDRLISFNDGESVFDTNDIAIDSTGNIFVVWSEDEPEPSGMNEIMLSYSTDGGATWSGSIADELISFPDGENGYRPDVSTLADGTWVAVWNEFNGTTSDNYEVHVSLGDTICTFGTLDCDYTVSPSSGTLPFAVNMAVGLTNNFKDQARRMAAEVNVQLSSGTYISRWRAGYTNIQPEDTYSSSWVQNLPALATLVGINTFTLAAEDVTPAPFNQPPYPAAGDTCTSTQRVEAYVP